MILQTQPVLTLLSRLLELNHQRYAEEVAAGGHEKGTTKDDGGALKLF